MESKELDWTKELPEGMFISKAPSYSVGAYFDLFEEDCLEGKSELGEVSMKYYFYDPTKHGYTKVGNYPLLIFLHGTSNALVGKPCVNYSGAELFASPRYQSDLQGAYILVPLANEYTGEDGYTKGQWNESYITPLHNLISDFIEKHTKGVGHRFLFGSSSGATMAFTLASAYTAEFKGVLPVGSSLIPEDSILDRYEACGTHLFYAFARRDEFHDFTEEVEPRLNKLRSMEHCFLLLPEWVYNGDGGVASIFAGVEMGQHCLMNAMQANLKFDDGRCMDERLPRGITGWLDEVNRGGSGKGRYYGPHGGILKTGHVEVAEGVELYYEEYGQGDRVILSAQVGFYHDGMQQRMAELGYHVYCITLRGFHPSSLIYEDYKERWYDVFASDVLAFADQMGIERFTYMGASHGAGVGWHLMLKNSGRVEAFIAVVAGPHSLKEGTMSYRQMIEQGIIKQVPPFDPPIDADEARTHRRAIREAWIFSGPTAFEAERRLDYGRPMMRLGTEERLCEELRKITLPTLLIGGYDDPISTPELLMRTAGCLPHCKLVMYSNCGHNIDTDLIEEVSDEADRFLRNAVETGRCYLPVSAN